MRLKDIVTSFSKSSIMGWMTIRGVLLRFLPIRRKWTLLLTFVLIVRKKLMSLSLNSAKVDLTVSMEMFIVGVVRINIEGDLMYVEQCSLCGKRLDEVRYIQRIDGKLVGSCCWKKSNLRNWIPVESDAGRELIFHR
jgi:hypothetical protein